MQGIHLRAWTCVSHKASTESCFHVSLMGFNQTLQIGNNVELRKWVGSKWMALRQRKSLVFFFPESSKIRKRKEPAVLFPLSFTHAQDWKEDWQWKGKGNPPPDSVQWASASGCGSHYKLGLVVGKSVREPKYCFWGWIHTVQDVKVTEESLRNHRKSFPHRFQSHKTHKKSAQRL